MGDVMRGNRFFVQVKGYGEANEKGKTILGVGLSGSRMIAPADKPLKLIAALIEQFMPAMNWSNQEAADKDLRLFKEFVNDMEIKAPSKPVSPAENLAKELSAHFIATGQMGGK